MAENLHLLPTPTDATLKDLAAAQRENGAAIDKLANVVLQAPDNCRDAACKTFDHIAPTGSLLLGLLMVAGYALKVLAPILQQLLQDRIERLRKPPEEQSK